MYLKKFFLAVLGLCCSLDVARRLSHYGTQAQELWYMGFAAPHVVGTWNLSGPEIEPVPLY